MISQSVLCFITCGRKCEKLYTVKLSIAILLYALIGVNSAVLISYCIGYIQFLTHLGRRYKSNVVSRFYCVIKKRIDKAILPFQKPQKGKIKMNELVFNMYETVC